MTYHELQNISSPSTKNVLSNAYTCLPPPSHLTNLKRAIHHCLAKLKNNDYIVSNWRSSNSSSCSTCCIRLSLFFWIWTEGSNTARGERPQWWLPTECCRSAKMGICFILKGVIQVICVSTSRDKPSDDKLLMYRFHSTLFMPKMWMERNGRRYRKDRGIKRKTEWARDIERES